MTRPLSYDSITKQLGNPPVPVRFVRAKCATCDRTEDFIWKSHHNPYHISNHFKLIGWEFDKYRRAKIKCPDCQKAKPTEDRTEEHLPQLDTFGQRFRYLREHAHLKRDDVADEAKFDRRMLVWLENGEEHPFRLDQGSISRLIEVLRKHDVPVNRAWLLDLSRQGATLASNVEAAMKKHNYVESTLADASGLPVSQIKMILSGAIPTHHRLPAVAKVLGTTAEELMGLPPIGKKIEPESVELVIISPELRSKRLREAREAKNLTQMDLAELIRTRDQNHTVQTIKWMVSNVERGNKIGSKEDEFLTLAAELLDVPADWLLGRTEESPTISEQTGIPESDVEEIIQRIARAESDLIGLNQLIDEAVQPIRQMAVDTKAGIEDLKAKLSRYKLPQRIMVALPPSAAPAVDPVPLALVNGTAHPRVNGAAHVNGSNGHSLAIAKPKPIEPKPFSDHRGGHTALGFIDRSMESKQNIFARALFRKVRNKHMNLAVIREKIGPVIEDLVPSQCSNADQYVRALIQREVLAKNGLLVRTGRGYWQLRDGAHI